MNYIKHAWGGSFLQTTMVHVHLYRPAGKALNQVQIRKVDIVAAAEAGLRG